MLTIVTQDAKARQSVEKPWLPRDRKLLGGALLIAALVAAAYCRILAKLVTEHRIEEDEAFNVAHDLAYRLVKRAYRL